ncbi:hypothetical protein [Nocardia arthritidis]|uniref:Ig-like domain-containing protein n=1 Tax=Nocardia arthritidis TaxID=228602 RepID=A0A6G9YIH3_9NOCA|nr:hypothetical protein [Nocardia arthritidis]QIS12743.1 hypothetical protein F5544_24440 [Nocardia arthritidis]
MTRMTRLSAGPVRLATMAAAATTLAVAFAAPASAATGPGNDLDIDFGKINNAGELTFAGTFSCTDVPRVTILVTATQGTTTGKQSFTETCDATGKPIKGALAPEVGTWSTSTTPVVTWTATMTSDAGVAVASQTGDEEVGDQNVSISVDTVTPVSGGLEVSGVYECHGDLDRALTVTVTAGLITGTAYTTVHCPTAGPTPVTVTVTGSFPDHGSAKVADFLDQSNAGQATADTEVNY